MSKEMTVSETYWEEEVEGCEACEGMDPAEAGGVTGIPGVLILYNPDREAVEIQACGTCARYTTDREAGRVFLRERGFYTT